MALSLARHDFLTVGPISASATMALLPPGKKKKASRIRFHNKLSDVCFHVDAVCCGSRIEWLLEMTLGALLALR